MRRVGIVTATLVTTVVQPARLSCAGQSTAGRAQQDQQTGQLTRQGSKQLAYSASGVMRSRVGTPPSDCQVGKCELVVNTAPSSSEISISRVKKRCRGMG